MTGYEKPLKIEGYVFEFNEPHHSGKVFSRNMFGEELLKTYLSNPNVLINHSSDKVVGRSVSLEADDKGLYGHFEIYDPETCSFIEDNILNEFDYGIQIHGDNICKGSDIEFVDKINLMYVSLISVFYSKKESGDGKGSGHRKIHITKELIFPGESNINQAKYIKKLPKIEGCVFEFNESHLNHSSDKVVGRSVSLEAKDSGYLYVFDGQNQNWVTAEDIARDIANKVVALAEQNSDAFSSALGIDLKNHAMKILGKESKAMWSTLAGFIQYYFEDTSEIGELMITDGITEYSGIPMEEWTKAFNTLEEKGFKVHRLPDRGYFSLIHPVQHTDESWRVNLDEWVIDIYNGKEA
jgi:hypothetical protein